MERTIFAQKITEVSTTRRDPLGALRCEDGKIYKYVKLYNTTATVPAVAGDVAAYDSETGAEDNTVVTDFSDADAVPVGAGIIKATVAGTQATAFYIWIQVSGPVTLNTAFVSAPADGGPCKCSTTDKALTKVLEVDSTGAYQAICAVANDASAKKVICQFAY